MMNPSFRLIATFALSLSLTALFNGCTSEAPLPDGTGGNHQPDASGQCSDPNARPLYTKAGCGAAAPAPVCTLEYACASKACSCNGKVILACDGYDEPYAYRLSNQGTDYATKYFVEVGDPCDPNAPDGKTVDAEAP